MRVLRLSRGCLTIVGALLTASCRDTVSGPQIVSATYVLRSMNGRQLPATAAVVNDARFELLADTLVFEEDGQVSRSYAVRRVGSGPSVRDTTYSQTLQFPYSIERNRVTIGYRAPCPANALCIGWEEGTLDAASVRLTSRLLWPGNVMIYARQ